MLGFAVTRQSPGKLAEELVQNSSFLLTKLFAIGIFLGFINILAEIGTFTYIAEFIKSSPAFVTVPVAVFIAFASRFRQEGYSVIRVSTGHADYGGVRAFYYTNWSGGTCCRCGHANEPGSNQRGFTVTVIQAGYSANC